MKKLRALMGPLVEDARVGPVHVCVYLALVMCKRNGAFSETWGVRREDVMRLAKITGKTTYYRVMKDLAAWGYIQYKPGDGMRRSEVSL